MEWKQYAVQDIDQVVDACASRLAGLSAEEVEERRRLKTPLKRDNPLLPLWRLIQRRFHSSFTWILFGAALLSFFLGDRIDSWLILTFIALNALLETVQEYQSERAARLLAQYLTTSVRVRRDGQEVRVASEEVERGDIVLFQVGDRLTADMRVLTAQGLMLDESVITGESGAVGKSEKVLSQQPTGMYQATNLVFAGTVVTGGCGEGVVFATGAETQFGETAALADHTERETVFEKGLLKFSRFIIRLVVVTIALVFIANIAIRGRGVDATELLIFSLVLAVSVIPEALPVITTVALSRGSLRLAKKKVIVKRLSAIEDLGSIDVLCSDKTGTLTENRMKVVHIESQDKKECLLYALLGASENWLSEEGARDPFDVALFNKSTAAGRKQALQSERLHYLPFDPKLRRNAVLVRAQGNGHSTLIVRGAPERILALSDGMTEQMRNEWLAHAEKEGRQGRRVLAIATKPLKEVTVFTAKDEATVRFLGIISFEDPLKASAAATIARAKALRVEVKIITGDSREVALSVGMAVGLVERAEQVITAEELFALSYNEQLAMIEKVSVIARVAPRQKFDIIALLETKHEVGFLGEGINDAPALKLANVAIVVDGASDVAREAADVILLRGDLETVIEGIREGRKIFSNILKYLKTTLTSNFGNFYSVALASFFLPFVPLLAVQILLLDLLSDFPMIAIATDTVDTEELMRPREYDVRSIILLATTLGVVSSLFDFILFAIYMRVGEGALQTAWFILSAFTEVILIYSLRTRKSCLRAHHPSLVLATLSVAILAAVLILPFQVVGQHFFHFARPDISMLVTVSVLAIVYFFVTESLKRVYYTHGLFVKHADGKKRV